mmetsp:Transcript_12984/g.20142  ORF Transcript_12984/g.20142 Transcript_12984/m.20142 type:complete len:488 (-) Transcript_12984:327-1790(-)
MASLSGSPTTNRGALLSSLFVLSRRRRAMFSSSLLQLGLNLTSIHFIGDLHADVGCAKQWVEKTGLVNLTATPYQWLGDPDKDAMVFLGDYVDKGSASSSVLEFVRSLQESFPDNIVTMLGNHDVFLIFDTALSFSDNNPHPLGHPFYEYAYSFMHPEEYLESEWVKDRDDDEELYASIATALQNVYDNGQEGSARLCAPSCTQKDGPSLDIFSTVSPFLENITLRNRTQERLATWREEYAQGLFDSGLLHWMTKQPLISIVGDALVTHGGVSNEVIQYLESVASKNEMTVADTLHSAINEPFWAFFREELGNASKANSIENRLTGGYIFQLIMDLVQDRGYFDQKNGCKDVQNVIDKVNSHVINENDNDETKAPSVKRIVVGHTPHNYAQELCDGKLLASDSSLSRSFRAHGNLYCPLGEDRRLKQKSYSCDTKPFVNCEGSISQITRESANESWPSSMKRMKLEEVKSMQKRSTRETPDDDRSEL